MSDELTDKEVAGKIRSQLGNHPEIEAVIVKGHLLQLHVALGLYQRLATDRERGRKIVLILMQSMKRLTGLSDVTIWIYCEKKKVIEGQVKDWGGDNVKYFYDL